MLDQGEIERGRGVMLNWAECFRLGSEITRILGAYTVDLNDDSERSTLEEYVKS